MAKKNINTKAQNGQFIKAPNMGKCNGELSSNKYYKSIFLWRSFANSIIGILPIVTNVAE